MKTEKAKEIDIFKHCAPLQRRFPLLPEVESIGYLRHKKDIVKYEFGTCNFSFILNGRGFYYENGVKKEIHAPCVLLQWPNEKMNYGPNEGETWEELYLIYPSKYMEALTNANVFFPNISPCRNFYRSSRFNSCFEKLIEIMLNKEPRPGMGITIDLLCWGLITASFTHPSIEEEVKLQIRKICDYLETHLAQDIHLDELAKTLNVSKSTLRRIWSKAYNSTTFRNYRDQYFLQRSCSLLIETDLSIKEISATLGFEDHYYFSRKFHILSGKTATAYRKEFGRDFYV